MTLDDDVAAKLKARARELGMPFKQVLNDALRRGLGVQPNPRRYRGPVYNMGGARRGVDLDKALALAAALEDAEIVAKMKSGK